MTAIQFDKYKVLPVEKLVKASWNYKTDNPDLLEKLKANIKRNGQVENILVRELPTGFYEIVNGNHRAQALMDLDIKEAVVFDLGKISDAQARRIAVETNETKFETDNIRLAEIIKEITEEFVDLDELSSSMPFSRNDLEQLSNLLDYDMDQYGAPADSDVLDESSGSIALLFSSEEERDFWIKILKVDGSMYSYTVESYRSRQGRA